MLLIAVLLIVAIAVHELGHAFAMRRHGVEMAEITLVGLGPLIYSFKLRRVFGDTPINIRLIPVGAYVQVTEAGLESEYSLSYGARADIYGGGVNANLVFGMLLIGVAMFVDTGSLIYTTVPLLIGLAIYAAKGPLCRFIYPTIGLLVPLFFLYQLYQLNPTESLGTVALVEGLHTARVADPTASGDLYLGASLSLAIGLSNLLPIHPFDGGKLLVNMLQRLHPDQYARWERMINSVLLISGNLLIMTAFGLDIIKVIIKLFF